MWEINVRENQRTIKNEQSGDTRRRAKTNKTKTTAIKRNTNSINLLYNKC